MRTLHGDDVVRMMKEIWEFRCRQLAEAVDLVVEPSTDGASGPLISPELKVRHKSSQIRYTVASVGPEDVILRTPEGEQFLVDTSTLENEYHLD